MFNYNEFYFEYRNASEQEKEKLLEQLKVALYFNYRVFFATDNDTASDFFCVFFKDLSSIIENYQGDAFFHYLRFIIQAHFLGFIKNKMRKKMLKQVGEKVTASKIDTTKLETYAEPKPIESFASEKDISYESEKVSKLREILAKSYHYTRKTTKDSKLHERILLLRYANVLGEEKIRVLCKLLNVDKENLLQSLNNLNIEMKRKEDITNYIQEKNNQYYCKFKMADEIINTYDKDTNLYYRYNEKILDYKKHWKRTSKKYLERSKCPSYSMIGNVLKLSKIATYRNVKRLKEAFLCDE